MEDLFEKEEYECICSECSKPFMTEDVNAEICPTCWKKIIGSELAAEGYTTDD